LRGALAGFADVVEFHGPPILIEIFRDIKEMRGTP
jgi:hypothetical protein